MQATRLVRTSCGSSTVACVSKPCRPFEHRPQVNILPCSVRHTVCEPPQRACEQTALDAEPPSAATCRHALSDRGGHHSRRHSRALRRPPTRCRAAHSPAIPRLVTGRARAKRAAGAQLRPLKGLHWKHAGRCQRRRAHRMPRQGARTDTTRWPWRPGTSCGRVCDVPLGSFRPSRPYSPRPHVQTSPAAESARLCQPPAEMSATVVPPRPTTGRGWGAYTVSPVPSWTQHDGASLEGRASGGRKGGLTATSARNNPHV